jgi:hypothetical protein
MGAHRGRPAAVYGGHVQVSDAAEYAFTKTELRAVMHEAANDALKIAADQAVMLAAKIETEDMSVTAPQALALLAELLLGSRLR